MRRAVAWACRFDKQPRCAQLLGIAAYFRANVLTPRPAGGEIGYILLILLNFRASAAPRAAGTPIANLLGAGASGEQESADVD
jgi:hypothetical protein